MGCALAVQVKEKVRGVEERPRVMLALDGEMEGESRTVGRREREEEIEEEEEEEGWRMREGGRGIGRGRVEGRKRRRTVKEAYQVSLTVSNLTQNN